MRAGGERRGNCRDRARRRAWLLETFDPDLGPSRARCHLKLSDSCSGEVDTTSLTVDRIDPVKGYVRGNIQPACRHCQNLQGALITRDRRQEWHRWMREADAAGFQWDGLYQ